jgi:hypothetical protein
MEINPDFIKRLDTGEDGHDFFSKEQLQEWAKRGRISKDEVAMLLDAVDLSYNSVELLYAHNVAYETLVNYLMLQRSE